MHSIKKVIGKSREIFQVGGEESCSMKYIGVLMNQSTEGIHLSTNTYCKDLPEIDATNIGSDRTRALFPEEITRLKQTSGQINGAVNQFRPDCAFDNCTVANSTKKPLLSMFTEPIKWYIGWGDNKWPYSSPVTLIFYPFISLRSAMRAMPTCQICDDACRYILLSWQNCRVKRVVNSTLAAECPATVEASDASIALSSLLYMLRCPRFPISVLCDKKSLVAMDNKML